METPRLHIPVMVDETLELLRARTLENRIFFDLTVGTGGHTEALLQHAPRSTVIGMDLDASTLELVQERLKGYSDRLILIHGDYREAAKHLENLGVEAVDGCLIDAGMSLWQVDTVERGLSFRYDAPLDMRYNRSRPPTAAELVNKLTAEQLSELFFQAGETRWARSIAENIVQHRRHCPITHTDQLVEIVTATIPARFRARGKIHPATRVFAALRQAVNEELDAIENGIIAAATVTAIHGRIVVLVYSSTEDRIAKTTLRRLSAQHEGTRKRFEATVAPGPLFSPQNPVSGFFTDRPLLNLLTKKPLVPTLEERRNNPRSRSAKLRAAEKISPIGPLAGSR